MYRSLLSSPSPAKQGEDGGFWILGRIAQHWLWRSPTRLDQWERSLVLARASQRIVILFLEAEASKVPMERTDPRNWISTCGLANVTHSFIDILSTSSIFSQWHWHFGKIYLYLTIIFVFWCNVILTILLKIICDYRSLGERKKVIKPR